MAINTKNTNLLRKKFSEFGVSLSFGWATLRWHNEQLNEAAAEQRRKTFEQKKNKSQQVAHQQYLHISQSWSTTSVNYSTSLWAAIAISIQAQPSLRNPGVILKTVFSFWWVSMIYWFFHELRKSANISCYSFVARILPARSLCQHKSRSRPMYTSPRRRIQIALRGIAEKFSKNWSGKWIRTIHIEHGERGRS